MRIIFAVTALLLSLGMAQDTHPTKIHVKKTGENYIKYTSKLVGGSVIELNFTMGFHHRDGKPIISEQLDVVAEQEGFEVTHLVGGADGSVNGEIPDFDLDLLSQHNVIFANNISGFGQAALGADRQSAIETAISEMGIGYLGFHASGDNNANGWSWFTNTLHPMDYNGHGARTLGKVYKHLDNADHMIIDGILEEKTVLEEVPNELDSQGNEVLASDVPTREMKNEWYRFGRDISRDPQYEDDVTILLKYDPRNLGDALPQQFRRLGGNMFTYLYKVGNGLTSYTPPGHENDELMSEDGSMDGGTGDYNVYHTQLLYFLAGYDPELCGDGVDCDGFQVVTAENHITGESCDGVTHLCGGPVEVIIDGITHKAPGIIINDRGINIRSETLSHTVKINNLAGEQVGKMVGNGNAEYSLNEFQSGIYFVQVDIPGMNPKIQRVFVQ